MNNLTYIEISELFELLGEESKNKIPNKFWEFIEKNKQKYYNKEEVREKLLNGNISAEALNLYSALKLKYLCEDELEKKILTEIYNYNKNDRNMKKKLTIENVGLEFSNDLFQKYNKKELNENEELIIVEKENFFSKVLKRIKQFFNK